MKIVALKTEIITPKKITLFKLIDKYIKSLKEESVIVFTSKIVSLCEGAVVKIGTIDKNELVKQEAELYIPSVLKKNSLGLTMKNNILIPGAGIDESNSAGYYTLWPKNPQKTANKLRNYLKKKFNLNKVGVIITDSRIIPLRWGTIGVAIAHSGFLAMKNYIGTPDLFGRTLEVSTSNIADALATAAVLVMGEGSEQTPIAIASGLNFIDFKNANPGKDELSKLHVGLKDPMYKPFFKKVNWQKGGNRG
ncbi:MAG: coenzyme F420-0:L-glutamate ligase [Patescibacteria group bacterium]